VLSEVVRLLRCPVCGAALTRDDRVLRCGAGHSYDIAKYGYVSLLAGRAPAGDTAEMVAARAEFLAAGHYRWLADLITDVAVPVITGRDLAGSVGDAGLEVEDAGLEVETESGAVPAAGGSGGSAAVRRAVSASRATASGGVVVDAGAGTGYYLAAVLDRLPDAVGIAVDSSAYALRRATRAHPRIAAVRADLRRELPLVDGAADLVLNVFAPRHGAEFRRVLAPDGALLTVTPTGRHLAELVDRLGLLSVDEEKDRRLTESLGEWFTLEYATEHEVTLRLDHAAVGVLVGMGPSARHTDAAALAARIAALPDPMPVTASCRLTHWRPR
jgi:23S rRNA (guanine745-N1)-methyltransferase